jgi:23S rRNA (adenine2030-N6)-methyltransferase
MNYRHAFHAGNFADVVKHVALTAILLHLRKKETPFAFIDTHAGRGLYDLASTEARKTSESENGIGRLSGVASAPPALATYLDLVAGAGANRYPGSSLIAAGLLRPQDRLVAIERHPEEVAALEKSIVPFRKARAVEGDGYMVLPGLLPPPERRGLVLIDPPYEKESEFHDAADALAEAHRRFATGIFLLWFPIKSAGDADGFMGELIASGLPRLMRLDIDVAPERRANDGPLAASGLAIVNAPFGFREEMNACADILAPLLGRDPTGRAKISVSVLAGD